MIGKAKIGLVIAATLTVGVIGAGLFIESGYYNIGADDHHTKREASHSSSIYQS